MDRVSLRTFLAQTPEQQNDAWYDWFCRDTSLPYKTKVLTQRLRGLLKAAAGKIDLDKHYVFFKNNCPMNGSLYDDFRICNIATGEVVYCIVPSSGFTSRAGQAELWTNVNGEFMNVLPRGASFKDLKAWFKTK